MSERVLRVGYAPGVTPDKWARAWRERRDGVRLELVQLEEAEAEQFVRDKRVDMALARLPVDRTGLHLVRLYDELPVVVVSREHPVAAYDEIELAELADEQFITELPDGFTPRAPQLEFPPMSAKEAIEVAASGTGIAILPMSVARLHHRKDTTHRPVLGPEPTTVALIWLTERDDAITQAFVGVTRGRTPRSSRG